MRDCWPRSTCGSGPSLLAATSIDEVNRLDPNRMLERSLDPSATVPRSERLAPTHLELPGGRRLPVDYRTEGPTVSSRAQDFFGLTQPSGDRRRAGRGRAALTGSTTDPDHAGSAGVLVGVVGRGTSGDGRPLSQA